MGKDANCISFAKSNTVNDDLFKNDNTGCKVDLNADYSFIDVIDELNEQFDFVDIIVYKDKRTFLRAGSSEDYLKVINSYKNYDSMVEDVMSDSFSKTNADKIAEIFGQDGEVFVKNCLNNSDLSGLWKSWLSDRYVGE